MESRILLFFTFFCLSLVESCGQFCFAQNNGLSQHTISAMQFSQFSLTDSESDKNFRSQNLSPAESVYKTSLIKDGLLIAGAVGGTLLGYELIKNKKDLTDEQLAGKTKDKLPFFDRGNAGYYSTQANKDSYILFDASYAIPVLIALIDKNERTKFGQVMVLYRRAGGVTGY